ncbi:MAG: hypothetical protein FWE86_01685, partial [Oscillospiraceae bacterium]|nr:hypothetical protein [Oscillospiraceae bacterium]
MGGSVAVSSSVLNAYFPNQQLDVPVLDTHASIEIVTDDNVYPVFGGYTGNIVFSGDRASLAAVVRPRQTLDKSVTWTSDRPDVASIDVNGVVTVKDVKTLSNVLITATTVAKDAWGNSRSETMTLTVLPNVPATGISFVNFGGKGGSADDPVEVVRGNEYWLDDYVLVSPASVTLNNSKYTASTLANNIAYLKHGWLVIDSSATNLGKVTTVTVRLGNFSDTLYIKVVDGPGTVEPGDGGSQGHGGSHGSGWGYGSHHGGGGGGR